MGAITQTHFVGVPSNLMSNSFWQGLLILMDIKPLVVGLLGFGITITLVLSFIYAWQYIARRGGKKP